MTSEPTNLERARSVEYDHNSPVVKALEAAHVEWMHGNCQDPACGCWTVIVNNHLAPLLDAVAKDALEKAAQVAEDYPMAVHGHKKSGGTDCLTGKHIAAAIREMKP